MLLRERIFLREAKLKMDSIQRKNEWSKKTHCWNGWVTDTGTWTTYNGNTTITW
jgi:hypothetical protein